MEEGIGLQTRRHSNTPEESRQRAGYFAHNILSLRLSARRNSPRQHIQPLDERRRHSFQHNRADDDLWGDANPTARDGSVRGE